MEINKSLIIKEESSLSINNSPPENLLKICKSYSKLQKHQKIKSWEQLLGKTLTKFIFGKDEYDNKNEGWPEKGCWNFAFRDYLWGLLVEGECIQNQGNPLTTRTFKKDKNKNYILKDDGLDEKNYLNKLIEGSAEKFRQLFLEAIILHDYEDWHFAPNERKQKVKEELKWILPDTLSCLSLLLNSNPEIEIIDSKNPNCVYLKGKVYKLHFKNKTIPAFCLGVLNNIPIFEIDSKIAPQSTNHRFGDIVQLNNQNFGRFIGLTLNQNEVFTTEDGIYIQKTTFLFSKL